MSSSASSLRSLRGGRSDGFFHRYCPFLFRANSLFYYGVLVFLIALGWIGYSLFANSMTQMLNWDYTWQYVPFAYTYHDAWRTFFATGKFPLYDFATWIGTDSIGSNSYYGLFDPFVIVMALFPKSWIPQLFAILTAVKILCAALLTRCFLKSMGIQENTARFAALAGALSGYVSFFVGFPSFLSAAIYVPMILWGIERVVRERKPGVLIAGVFLEGISSFFFLVVVCIFGVIYALWRYFTTFRQRNAKENWAVIGMGVACFALGIMLSAFSLLPSVRESSLSGRGSSIGTAYLHALISAFKGMDLRHLFSLVFEMVGDHPGRELMGMLSFFFPTAGHIALPLARSGYDAWTSALFCYTPCVILFFMALLESIRQRKGLHLFAVLLCVYAVFTNFSYYFFYAFTGNGYGRWYIILIPLIVYYCAWGFDQRKVAPRYMPVLAGILALGGTIATFYLTDFLLTGIDFPRDPNNMNNLTYWQTQYVTASEVYNHEIVTAWYFYYQLALVSIDSFLFLAGQRKKWMPKAFFCSIAVEAIVMGNLAYAYDGLWDYQYWFAGGEANRDNIALLQQAIDEKEAPYVRTYSDYCVGNKYSHRVGGLNASAEFHSLMNFDVEEFAIANQMKGSGSTLGTAYGTSGIKNASWSGYYANKREGTDSAIGYRYYQVSNSYSAWKLADGSALFPTPNVPFEAEEVEGATKDRNRSRFYRVPDSARPQLGYAVDSDKIYPLIHTSETTDATNFTSLYGGEKGFRELLRFGDTISTGAIVGENEELPEGFAVQNEIPDILPTSAIYNSSSNRPLKLLAHYYTVKDGDLMVPSTSASYYEEGLGFFLNHYETKTMITGRSTILRDRGMVAFTPANGEYFNDDIRGTYFDMYYFNSCYSYLDAVDQYNAVPRVYVIGDSYHEDGTLKKSNDVLCFEYNMFEGARKADGNHSYYGYARSAFGLYAKGRAKAVVFCFPGHRKYASVQFNPNDLHLRPISYSSWRFTQDKIQKDKLQNVKYETNAFTFDTAYTEDRLVRTSLGYDQGWKATATLPNGTKQECKMIKINGGLVGFFAPHALDENGKPLLVHYELRYSTPYSTLSAALWVGASLIILGYVSAVAAMKIKEEKKRLAALQVPTDSAN
ncbi:MAG: YfhO family protein [Candidatus Enteromonas sp.]|nr:YfhO family protein [Candidatus Enteromonas sp.]